jgi:beta-fructofuranosidase
VLKLPDKWVWDFWIAQDGVDYHIFFLQAPKTLEQEKLRHWNATIGHAVSRDLVHWEHLPVALLPGPDGSWDDYMTWTGSIVRSKETWYFFYTGGCRSDKGLVQKIGLATSHDLETWEKYPANPIITADSRWYETLNLSIWHEQAWRDPWVFQHPENGEWHAFITGRVNHGPPDGRGCIAHARSEDLVNWKVLPPVSAPGAFGHMEVPQLVEIGNRYYLLFSITGNMFSKDYRQNANIKPVTGTYCLVSDEAFGGFVFNSNRFLPCNVQGVYYSGKIVRNPVGDYVFLTYRHFSDTGEFIGEICNPIPIDISDSGD